MKELLETDTFQSFNGLRFVFILGIVLFHTHKRFSSPFNRLLHPVYQFGGYFGNYMLFMLSGFCVAHRYGKELLTRQKNILSFLMYRLRKIYPMYALSNVISLLLVLPESGMGVIKLDRIVETFTLTTVGWIHNRVPYNVPSWFVNVLFQIYCYYGGICYISNTNQSIYLFLLICGAIHGYILIDRKITLPFSYVHNGEGFFSFFTGALLYELLFHQKRINISVLYYWSFCILTLVTVLSTIYGLQSLAYDYRVIIILLFCPNYIIASMIPPLRKVLGLAIIQPLADMSMFISFWHMPYARVFSTLIPHSYQPYLHFSMYILTLYMFGYIHVKMSGFLYRKCERV